jgi:hypothetical protein
MKALFFLLIGITAASAAELKTTNASVEIWADHFQRSLLP